MTLLDAFLAPGWLALAAAAPVVWIALSLHERARRRRIETLLGPRASRLGTGSRRTPAWVPRAAASAGLLLAALAAADPAWGEGAEPAAPRGAALVVCLDVSQSMLARDQAPSRLATAKREIAALVARADGDRFGLVAFAGDARIVAPLTHDARSFLELVRAADPADARRGGTDLGAALVAALRALDGRTDGPAAVLLLTDGEDHAGRGAAAARACAERGVAVHCVGFGTRAGAKIAVPGPAGETFLRDRAGREVVSALAPESLRAVAAAGGGTFVEAASVRDPLVALLESEIAPSARRARADDERRARRRRFQAPLLGAFLCCLIVLHAACEGRAARASAPTGRPRAPRAPSPTAPAAERAVLARVLACLGIAFLAGCGDVAAGVEAYRAGRYEEAHRTFAAAAAEAGESASPELQFDLALAALRVGALGDAERAAQAAAKRGGSEFEPLRDFLLGNVAYARCELAEAQAGTAEAEPFALDVAIVHAEAARRAFERAAESRTDWPEARRNVERALLKAQDLRDRKAGKEPPSKKRRTPDPRPRPAPPSDLRDPPQPEGLGGAGRPGEDAETAAPTPDLPPAEVRRLFERLAEKEGEKLGARRARRAARAADVERDW